MIKNNLKYFPEELIICPNCKSNKISFQKKIIFCNNCKESYPVINDIPILITKKNCKKLNLNYHKKNLEYEILNSKNFKLNQFGILKYVENIFFRYFFTKYIFYSIQIIFKFFWNICIFITCLYMKLIISY